MSEEPIKFRCYRCGKLLGASVRRVGAVVPCPQCQAEIQVPDPNAVGSVEEAKPAGRDLGEAAGEAVDFDATMLATEPLNDPVIPTIRYESPTIRDASPQTSPRGADVILPPGVVLAWSLLVLAAIPLAFIAGLLIGRFIWK